MLKNITANLFIDKSNEIHSSKYDYSLVNYINNKTKVKIICKKHGIFEQTPTHHVRGSNCPKCSLNKSRQTKSDFIDKSNKIHSNRYDYSLVNYINNKTKVKIICKKHGIFEQTPTHHVRGSNCPKCKISKGEQKVINWLEKNKIKYIYDKKFKDHNIRPDFYLPNKNIIIEYDGIQHFKAVKHFKVTLSEQQQRDKYKNSIYNKYEMKIIRIPYTKYKNIYNILENNIVTDKKND